MKVRSEIDKSDQWDLDSLFSSTKEWLLWRESLVAKSAPYFPSLAPTSLATEEELKLLLDHYFSLQRRVEKLAVFAHCFQDQEMEKREGQELRQLSDLAWTSFAEESAWIRPSLLQLPEETFNLFMQSEKLVDYRFFLEKLALLRPHTLTSKEEAVIAQAEVVLHASDSTFSLFNNVDLSFGEVLDQHGSLHELTHANYGLFLRNSDPVLRKNSFETIHGVYERYSNTCASLLRSQKQSYWLKASLRHFTTTLASALLPKNIPTSLYDNLLSVANRSLCHLQRYLRVRKKLLGVKELHVYDLYLPFDERMGEENIPYEKAVELIVASVAPLGEEYQKRLRDGLTSDRWVDRYENRSKRSGGYSSGCYDSKPFILMNYKNRLKDLFTLAHEAGHSMHSDLSRASNPYHYADYPIFVAEIASTFNEQLLFNLLLREAKDSRQRLYLLVEAAEEMRTTFFRQTMFAEFELQLCQAIEKREAVTKERLSESYHQLCANYFGNEVILDPKVAFEWARIPHFYSNFYVYQYATGLSAAVTLARSVKEGGEGERKGYLSFLKGGGSGFPLDLLRKAGVDMATKKPLESAMDSFSTLIDAIEREADELRDQTSSC